ncbi:MAG TPA: PAS domain-containing protein [Gaiellaceae bacterium]|nr:PAS domain-containing protein [Gaiellaceae bacterium]
MSEGVPRELLEHVLAALDEGVIVVDGAGNRVYANEQAARLTGYGSAAELLAAPRDEAAARFELRDAEGRPLRGEDLPGRRALAGAEPGRALIRFRAGDGPERVSEVRAISVRDARGAVAYAVTFFREVTNDVGARERVEARYRDAMEAGALLDALYDSAPVGLGFWDRDLRYARVNEALAAINERSADDHVGRTFREVVPQLADELEALVRDVLETGRPVIGREMTAGTPLHPDLLRHWSASYYPVVGAEGEPIGVGAVIEETTERRRAEQLTELQHTVTSVLSGAETVEAAVRGVLAVVCTTLGWDVACFWSTEPDARALTWARTGAELDGFLASTERASLSPELLPGRVVQRQAVEWLVDFAEEPFPRAAVAEAEGLRSGVAFPVLVRGEAAGAVEAFSRVRREVDHELAASLEALGRQLGQFLQRKRVEDERARLLQREQAARADAEAAAATLRKLARVSEAALEHLSLHDLLPALLTRIVAVLEADTGAILLLGDDGHLHVRATVGLGEGAEYVNAIPLGEGMAGAVAASRAPLLVPDLAHVELASPVLRERGINSVVAIPLVVEDRVIGVVHAGSEQYAKFVEDDARLLELIADRIALAINQASLYEAEQVAQERLRFLGEASILLGSSLDVDRTLEQLGGLVAGRVAHWCSTHLVTESPDIRLVTVVHQDDSKVDALRAELARTKATERIRRVIRGGRPSVRADSVVVPLSARGRTFGAMALGWDGATPPRGEALLEFALDLARRAAIAIDNAQLYGAAQERAQAARVLASVGDGVFLVDRAGVIRTWNRAAAAATGLPASSVVDRPAAEAVPGWAAIAPRITITPSRGTAPRPESLPLDVGGREVWLSIHGVAVPDGVVYAFRDLTEERALEQLRNEFVSTVSHELRTPLAAIYGAAMTLRRSDVALDDDQRARLLDVVSGEADRLARTVNDILWASRLDSDSLQVTIESCEPLDLVADVIHAQEAHLDPSHELVVEAADELPPIAGDVDKVGRVLINLVDNAVKYSPDGGRVTVTVAPVGSHVRFSVSDQGLGIPLTEQRRVFEKFYRLDPNMNRGVGGTGLGLYICRELVRRMEGRIWVESAGLGRGSTFHVELPAAAPPH